MWTIRELKQAGKRHFLRNWVSMVAVCFLLAFAGVEFTQSAEFIHQFDPREVLPGDHVAIQTVNLSNWELLLKWLDIQPGDGNHPLWAAADRSFGPLFDTLTSPFSAFFAFLERSSFAGWLDVLLAGLGIAGGLWFSVWVLGPAAVGARRFYLESRVRDNISISAMFTPFGRGKWWNITKTMLLRSVYLALWTFTIVGFPIFYYSYLMTPYILAENPNLSHREALRLSRRMMRGQKWHCFLLDAVFYLQWSMLPTMAAALLGTAAGLAFGNITLWQSIFSVAAALLSLLYVNGYRAGSYTALYVRLRQDCIDAGEPLSVGFAVPAFGEAPPEGIRPKLPRMPVTNPEDSVFHFAYHHKLDYNRHYSVNTLILLFFAFSFVGWAWEVCLHIVSSGMFVNRGTMLGPWLPIYGSGGVLVLLLLRRLFNRPVATFLVSMALCSVIEYFTSWYLEMTKGIRWWDYTGYFMNLNGRICLEGAVIFGLGCCLAVYVAAPALGGLIDRLSPAKRNALCAVLLALFAADAAYSHIHPNSGEGITTD